MNDQPNLFPALKPDTDAPKDLTPSERFQRFHEMNPSVYKRLAEMAYKVKAAGFDHYGIATLYEVLRYRAMTTTGDPYKLNNNFRAYYARLIMERNPTLDGLFHLRTSNADTATL